MRFPASVLVAFGTLLLLSGVARAASGQQSGSSGDDNEVVEFKAFYDEGGAGRMEFDIPRLSASAKKSWPELVGKRYDEAKAVIEREAPDVRVYMVPVSSAVTTDYSLQRVRVFVSDDGRDVVELTPMRG